MKKLIFVLVFVLGIFLTADKSFAATVSPTSEVSQELQQKLLKQIASKAAQLKLTEKRGIIGTVKESTDTSITLTDVAAKTRFVDVDELTNFSSPTLKSFGISDVEKGMTIGILGLYNKDSRRILAREVNVVTFPKVITGVVSAIDEENFQLTVKTEKESVKVDVEKITKTSSYKDDGLSSSGFSKITLEETIVIIGYPDSSNPEIVLASRILIFPDIPKNPKIILTPAPSEESATIVPSTGSGIKIQPITE